VSELKVLPPPAPNERVVQELERLLEKAKAGELRAFVAALSLAETKDGRGGECSGVSRAGRARVAGLVWGLERAKLRLMGFVEDVDIDLDLGGLP
jgi:hypothetical protein